MNDYTDRLIERFGEDLVSVRLFGSFAKGSAHEESDVDIAVVLESLDWQARKAAIDSATDIGLEHGLYLSPTLFDRATYELWLRQDRALVRDIEQGIQVWAPDLQERPR